MKFTKTNLIKCPPPTFSKYIANRSKCLHVNCNNSLHGLIVSIIWLCLVNMVVVVAVFPPSHPSFLTADITMSIDRNNRQTQVIPSTVMLIRVCVGFFN